ncbi:MAG: hypothetical protein KME64_13435 [Scytonematopsis contorta HA4267-MV1]|jgi:hypothetical protein|nr:hypothetical protein [Scytonematopsis contorta HA4267-MV1]
MSQKEYEELFSDLQAIVEQNGETILQETSKLAIEGYKEDGRGCVQIDLTEYRQKLQDYAQKGLEIGEATVSYFYWKREKFIQQQQVLELIDSYDPQKELVVICTDSANPSETLMVGFIDALA